MLICGEPFGSVRAIGYGAIWVALALYSSEGLRGAQGSMKGGAPPPKACKERSRRRGEWTRISERQPWPNTCP